MGESEIFMMKQLQGKSHRKVTVKKVAKSNESYRQKRERERRKRERERERERRRKKDF